MVAKDTKSYETVKLGELLDEILGEERGVSTILVQQVRNNLATLTVREKLQWTLTQLACILYAHAICGVSNETENHARTLMQTLKLGFNDSSGARIALGREEVLSLLAGKPNERFPWMKGCTYVEFAAK